MPCKKMFFPWLATRLIIKILGWIWHHFLFLFLETLRNQLLLWTRSLNFKSQRYFCIYWAQQLFKMTSVSCQPTGGHWFRINNDELVSDSETGTQYLNQICLLWSLCQTWPGFCLCGIKFLNGWGPLGVCLLLWMALFNWQVLCNASPEEQYTLGFSKTLEL